MKNTRFMCPHTSTKLIPKKETYKVKGELITIDAQVTYCENCGQEIFVPNIDDNNLQKAYAIYRKNHNLLNPKEITMLREKYKLTQKAFSILTKCSLNTIINYENGAIPSEEDNQTFKSMMKFKNVLK
jgi:putative zinc finger/helix-turn-helix YgiT family protein